MPTTILPFAVEVRPSPYHGLGLFALERIPEGAIWWNGTEANTVQIRQAQYETLRAAPRPDGVSGLLDMIHTYAYYEAPADALILILDDSRFINHSEAPNAGGGLFLQSAALRTIEPGEELVEDYRDFDHCPWAQLYGDFGRVLYGTEAA